jgi:hypothetical protein
MIPESDELDEKWLAQWFASKKREFNVQMGLTPLSRPGDPIPPSHCLANYMGHEIKVLFDTIYPPTKHKEAQVDIEICKTLLK